MEDRDFMLDARLAGMKAALALTPEREKLRAPFESAVRDAVKARREARREMRERMHSDGRPSPIERMNEISDRLATASAELKQVADAAKPLYDGLDETRKRHFGSLAAEPARTSRARVWTAGAVTKLATDSNRRREACLSLRARVVRGEFFAPRGFLVATPLKRRGGEDGCVAAFES